MKIQSTTMAIATVILSLPLSVLAQGSQNSASAAAQKMVPVNAALSHDLDAKKDHPGSPVEAKLSESVRLADGTELPSGSSLLGKVAEDDMQQQGTSKLALRFDQARLKDGKVIPIRATIVGIFHPVNAADGSTGDQVPNTWSPGTLQMDQLGVIPGVDLHSNVASADSGVFVSTKKDDVKLYRGSQLQLAIAPSAEVSNVGGN